MRTKLNLKIVFNLVSVLMLINALFMLICVPISLYYNESTYLGILIAGIITLLIGGSIYFLTKNASKKVGKREGYLIVSFGWICLCVTGTLPYLCSNYFYEPIVFENNTISFTNYFFEVVSGYTTTGSTTFNDIEVLPKGILFWRSLTHWIGGMGIIVLTIAILPFLGIGGMQLFSAEATGITTDKLHPRITDTAKRLWAIYVMFTGIEAVILYFSGMSVFDAANHAMSTLSTGGFSTKNESTAFWNNNPAVQYTIIVFMFLAGTNFILNYYLIKRRFSDIFKNEEFRWYLGVVLGISIIASVMIYLYTDPIDGSINHANITTDGHYTYENSLRYSLFQVISLITTTGFTSANHTLWTPFVTMLFFALYFVGGSAGSTAGGVKIIRHVVLLKNSWFEFKRLLHPNAIIPVRYNKKSISQNVVYNVLAFFVIYMLIWISSSVVIALMNEGVTPGYEQFISSLSITASCLGNVGPALGKYDPVSNIESLTTSAKWFLSFIMLLGRLELFTFLIILTPFLWKNN